MSVTTSTGPQVGVSMPSRGAAHRRQDWLVGTLRHQPGSGLSPGPDGTRPDPVDVMIAALAEQLGLKLESAKETVEVLVIDHVERPSEN